MKANKYICLALAMSLFLVNKTAYADSEDINKLITNFIDEDTNIILSSDDSLDENIKEKENLKDYIEEIKNTTDYIDSSEEIKTLYDNAIEFNSRALDKDSIDWISFSYDNLKEDIEIIKKLDNGDYIDKENINQSSTFFNNPLYKVAYLKLDNEKREILDDYNKVGDDQEALSLYALSDSDEKNVLVLFCDWMYPFMNDEDSDGIISDSKILIDALNEDKTLIETFQNTKFEDRYNLVKDIINKHEESEKDSDLDKEDDSKVTNDDDLIDDSSIGDSDQTSDPSQTSDSEELDTDKEYDDISKYKYQSMFYIKNRTRKYYEDLSDEQRDELDSMNTDNDGVLTIEELEKSHKYTLPIINGLDWLYPFMYDKNDDGIIDESDRNTNNEGNEINPNGLPVIDNENNELGNSNTNKSYDSVFYTNTKTRAAYENLSDERKQILDRINTDGKYPLTLAEVEASGMFQIPVSKDEWIYPFMIDRNNSGEVGESYDYFKNLVYTPSSNPTTSSVENVAYTSSYYPLTSTTTTSNNRTSHTNVKTGIKGLGTTVIVLVIASVAYYLSKKKPKTNIKLH